MANNDDYSEEQNKVIKHLRTEGVLNDPQIMKTAFAITAMAKQVDATIEMHFAQFELSQARYSILLAMHTQPENNWTAVKLAALFQVSKPTLTAMLRSLERDNWIKRKANVKDARVWDLSFSIDGKAKFEKLLSQHFEQIGHLFDGMDVAEMQAFEQVAGKIQQAYGVYRRDYLTKA